MSGPLKFTERKNGGRGRGLIQLYILHSLKDDPKSGYELLKEISVKTKGAWVPSKGTLYPMLKKMDEEGLITISDTGKRCKNIFELTPDGKDTLDSIVRGRKEEKEKFFMFRDLLVEIFGEENGNLRSDLLNIRSVAEGIPAEKQDDVQRIINKCLAELQELNSDESGSS
ncbi:PadR family transcriptional regulator [Methanoplanus endosymbiosus]|uniref:PadR family transcriptional regulator n=1 Tax=Methanoplanus endosymbiosus TaxID=33865 RepID=A0A9E7PLZ0_9EURY|nr:PadR family transcriptional regulator [Methanoplanus endosymbiosus]UUX92598.1 PadR family transcriptional regulator [Methanoplanus endosymbiosus]